MGSVAIKLAGRLVLTLLGFVALFFSPSVKLIWMYRICELYLFLCCQCKGDWLLVGIISPACMNINTLHWFED